jgi:hypothetical protein
MNAINQLMVAFARHLIIISYTPQCIWAPQTNKISAPLRMRNNPRMENFDCFTFLGTSSGCPTEHRNVSSSWFVLLQK